MHHLCPSGGYLVGEMNLVLSQLRNRPEQHGIITCSAMESKGLHKWGLCTLFYRKRVWRWWWGNEDVVTLRGWGRPPKKRRAWVEPYKIFRLDILGMEGLLRDKRWKEAVEFERLVRGSPSKGGSILGNSWGVKLATKQVQSMKNFEPCDSGG